MTKSRDEGVITVEEVESYLKGGEQRPPIGTWAKEDLSEMISDALSREFGGSKLLKGVQLFSSKLKICGTASTILITPWGELIPLEVRDSFSKAHKYVIALLALLIEEKFNKKVKRGLLLRASDRKLLSIKLTGELKRKALETLEVVRNQKVGKSPDLRAH